MSPAGFLTVTSHGNPNPWIPYRHHALIDAELVKVALGKTQLLILQVPIQHGKSTLGSVGNAVWTLGRFPERFVVAISHTQDFARDRIGAPARQLFERYGEQIFDLKIDRRSDASDRWNIAGHEGGFFCTGVGAAIEGRRIDLAIIDDPIGTLAEAQSEKYQQGLYDWYQAQLYPRLAPKAGIIVIMSRWSRNDFVARLIDAGINGTGPTPVVIDLPAVALQPEEYSGGRDPLRRQPGEALWPEVRPLEFLRGVRNAIGERFFAARYLGRPGAPGGTFFKKSWLREYEFDGTNLVYYDNRGGLETVRRVPYVTLRRRQYIDLATSLKSDADYFVILTVGINPVNKDVFILNVLRDRVAGPDQRRLVFEQFGVWKPQRIKIEAVGYQLAFVQSMIAEGLPVAPILRGRGDKAERATQAAVRYEQGCVFHPRTAGWKAEFENELLAFPRGGHDDQVDTIADACNDLTDESDESDLAGGYLP